MSLTHILHDGSLWLLLACFVVLVGVILGLYTRSGSEITSHAFTKPATGGALGSDLPAESIGRPALEPLLWGHHHPEERR